MAMVLVEGNFMGCNLHETIYEGNKRVAVLIDIYQPNSPAKNKTIQVKTEEVSAFSTLKDSFSPGDKITAKCVVNAYQNDPKFKLIEIVA